MKIFCVGRNKTGTTTMQAIFRDYGFRVAPQAWAEFINHRRPSLIWRFIDFFEAFQDIPFSYTSFIKPLYERYPDARYILTTRDPDLWFRSLVNHHYALYGLPHDAPKAQVAAAMQRKRYTYGNLYKDHCRQFRIAENAQLYDRARYIDNLERHNAMVRETIPARQLLEIDLSEHETTAPLVKFIGRETVRAMPHENRRL